MGRQASASYLVAMVTELSWQPQRYVNNSFVSSHIESTFGMELLWDNRYRPYTSFLWKLGCHGSHSETSETHLSYCVHSVAVSMATRDEADAYCPKEPPYQMWIQYDLRQRSY